jgi:hypothetical protein
LVGSGNDSTDVGGGDAEAGGEELARCPGPTNGLFIRFATGGC